MYRNDEPPTDPREDEQEAWEDFCTSQNGPSLNFVNTILGVRPAPPMRAVVPVEASEPDHPDHAIYTAWQTLEGAICARFDRLQAEDDDSTYLGSIDYQVFTQGGILYLDEYVPNEEDIRGDR